MNGNHPFKHDSKLTRRQFIEQAAVAGLTTLTLAGCDPLNILSPPSIPIETEDGIPALIIGSGFGGAVTALRLGEAGIRTMVLEQGRRWDTGTAPFSRSIPLIIVRRGCEAKPPCRSVHHFLLRNIQGS